MSMMWHGTGTYVHLGSALGDQGLFGALSFPNLQVVGYEILETSVHEAKRIASIGQVDNCKFEAKDVINVDLTKAHVVGIAKLLCSHCGTVAMISLCASSHRFYFHV